MQADEFTKFQAALMWSKKFCDTNPVSLFKIFWVYSQIILYKLNFAKKNPLSYFLRTYGE